MLRRRPRAELERELMLRLPHTADHIKIDISIADRLVIVAIGHIVEVKPNQAVDILLEVLLVVEQPHLLLQRGVTGIVPVTTVVLPVLIQAFDKLGVIRIHRQLLKFLPILTAQHHAFFQRVGADFFEAGLHLFPVSRYSITQLVAGFG